MDHTTQPAEPTPPELNLPESSEERTPLGFKVFAGFAIAYVILRVVQMVGWGIDWLFGG